MAYICVVDNNIKIYSFNPNFTLSNHHFTLVYNETIIDYIEDYVVHNSSIIMCGFFRYNIDGHNISSIAIYKIGNETTNGRFLKINGTTSPVGSFIYNLFLKGKQKITIFIFFCIIFLLFR
jgi:hypothetical protein